MRFKQKEFSPRLPVENSGVLSALSSIIISTTAAYTSAFVQNSDTSSNLHTDDGNMPGSRSGLWSGLLHPDGESNC